MPSVVEMLACPSCSCCPKPADFAAGCNSRVGTYASFDKGKAYGMEIKVDVSPVAGINDPIDQQPRQCEAASSGGLETAGSLFSRSLPLEDKKSAGAEPLPNAGFKEPPDFRAFSANWAVASKVRVGPPEFQFSAAIGGEA